MKALAERARHTNGFNINAVLRVVPFERSRNDPRFWEFHTLRAVIDGDERLFFKHNAKDTSFKHRDVLTRRKLCGRSDRMRSGATRTPNYRTYGTRGYGGGAASNSGSAHWGAATARRERYS